MLWLALHFPLLPLEALNCPCTPDGGPVGTPPPAAIVVSRGRVLSPSPAAREAGVEEGMVLSSALGLVPGLAVFEREPAREAAALFALACWCGQFTPQVSLVPPSTLLLEIGGCLRLFGGLENLHANVRDAACGQGFTIQSAMAPTPLGATWLAWAADNIVCPELPALHRALARLPSSLPAWGAVTAARLQAFGAATLADVMALPRAELGRRVGAIPVAELARARGDVPDPRAWFSFPEKFSQSLELPAKVEAAEMLVFAGQRLLGALAGWLAAREAGVAACVLKLFQDGGRTTEVLLRPAAPTRDEGRLVRLLRERLSSLLLSAPVLGLELRAGETISMPGTTNPLFAGERAEGEGALLSLERLRARLGEERVFTLAAHPDYRPECATGRLEAKGEEMAFPVLSRLRPLWLLPEPKPLPEIAGRPQWQGGLNLIAGPERLESGWWDEGEAVGDVRRDYFVAGNSHGQYLWIFRNAEGWFLHGLFA